MIGIVYVISCKKDTKLFYVGSTVDTLNNRFQNHLYLYLHWCETGRTSTGKISIYPYFDKFGLDNFEIKSVWTGKICDKKHLSAYEQLYINKYKSINKQDVLHGIDKGFFRKCKKSTIEYKVMKATSDKKYREKNSDKCKLKSKQWSEKNGVAIPCECGGEVSIKHRTDHLKTKLHLHFVNTGTRLEKKPKQHICICGSTVPNTPSHISKHENTLLHKNFEALHT